MTSRRGRQTYEPIKDLFGDVVRDGPSSLYGDGPEPDAGPIHAAGGRDPRLPPRPPAAGATGRVARDAAPEFRDDNGLLSAVVILHGALTVLTLGLYRFWLKTQQRRVIWSHTRVEDEPLEYTGRGGELLLGALIALVFVGGLLAMVNLAAVFAGLYAFDGFGPAQAARAGLVAAIAVAPLFPYAAFQARRYRLSRTRWRGIRFGMAGRPLGMVALWAMWMPAVVASAGLLWPWWRWARERRLSRAMRWGSEPFGFEGSARPLLARWLPLWALGAGTVALAASPELRARAGLGDPAAVLAQAGPGALMLWAGLAALLVWLLWLNYRAAEIRLFWNARRLAGAQARSRFSLWHMLDAYVAVLRRAIWPGLLVWLLIAAVTAIPLFGAARAELENPGAPSLLPGAAQALSDQLFGGLQSWRAQALVLMAIAVNYLLATVFAMWLWMAVHARVLHGHVCHSLELVGVQGLDAVRQRAADPHSEAEGMADALDAAGF